MADNIPKSVSPENEEKRNTLRKLLEEGQVEALVSKIEHSVEQSVEHSIESFSGPLPHPDHMRSYKAVDKSLPNRIVAMAENAQKHRAWREKFQDITGFVERIFGQFVAAAVTLLLFWKAGEMIMSGKSTEGIGTILTTLVGLVGLFVYGKSRDRTMEESEQRKE